MNPAERVVLTPDNKNPEHPPCNIDIAVNRGNCYLNPLNSFPECIYSDNWWQEEEKNICFPKVSDEEFKMDDIESYLPDNPTSADIRQAILKLYSPLGIIPHIEQQLQESSSIKTPKIPASLFPKVSHRPMTPGDFRDLNHKYGEKVSGPHAMPNAVDNRYTKHDNDRYVGRNPIPIIEARTRFEEETKQPLTYRNIIDFALFSMGENSDDKKIWKKWFLMSEAKREEKEQARDQPLSPFRTSYNRITVADPNAPQWERVPGRTYGTVEEQKKRWWTDAPLTGYCL